MFGRDFSNESYVNMAFRIFTALESRARGWLYLRLGVFSSEIGSKLVIGRGCQLIDGRNIHVQGRVKIGSNARLECHKRESAPMKGQIILKDNVSLGNNVHIGSTDSVELHEGVLVGSNVLITDHSHGTPRNDVLDRGTAPRDRPLISKGGIVVESNCWICDGVVILSGVTVEAGSVLGANAVIRTSVPLGGIVK